MGTVMFTLVILFTNASSTIPNYTSRDECMIAAKQLAEDAKDNNRAFIRTYCVMARR